MFAKTKHTFSSVQKIVQIKLKLKAKSRAHQFVMTAGATQKLNVKEMSRPITQVISDAGMCVCSPGTGVKQIYHTECVTTF